MRSREYPVNSIISVVSKIEEEDERFSAFCDGATDGFVWY